MLKKIAVASPEYPATLKEGLTWVDKLAARAAEEGAQIICFPESFLPGYPLEGYEPERCTPEQLHQALQSVCQLARQHRIAIIIPMDWHNGAELLNVAYVISQAGEVLGFQTKNQLDPSEDTIWKPGTQRHLFEIDGLRFGIVICHEGFRYPETVRWAALRGAHVVFHPNLCGSRTGSYQPAEWGSKASPYYEKAQMVRALENTIYFAPSNYTLPFPESASAVIDPVGNCIAHQAYGEPGVTVAEIDTDKATGLLAKRLKQGLYDQSAFLS